MEVIKVLSIFLTVGIYQVNCLKCFNCVGVDSIDKCTTSVDCKANEHCHARQYIDGNGQYVFDVNCKPLTLCSKLEQSRRDESSDGFEIEMWTSCCGQDYCNMHFDHEGNLIDPSKRVMECYSCEGISDPADCTKTTVCKAGEVCLTHEKISGTSKVFDMGCLPKVVCGGIGYHLELSKRKRHMKRFELCRACCDRNDKCNNQFCSHKLGQTDMTAIGTPVVRRTTTAAPPSTPTASHTNPLDSYALVVTPANQTGAIGSTVVFDCEFDKSINESMTMTWYYKDRQGQSKQIYSGVVNPPALDFYVKFLDVTDNGEYICEANYNGHTWTATGTLNVPGYIEITKGPDTLAVKRGHQATFTCNVDGIPKPKVTWELLHNSPHPKAVTSGVSATSTGSQLIIDHVSDRDSGVYKCVATNALGTKSALAVLNVT